MNNNIVVVSTVVLIIVGAALPPQTLTLLLQEYLGKCLTDYGHFLETTEAGVLTSSSSSPIYLPYLSIVKSFFLVLVFIVLRC